MAAVFSLIRRGIKVLHVLVLLYLWLLLVLYLGFKLFERQSMLQTLPAALEVKGVEWIAGESGFREGCGVAVFRLSAAARQQLHDHGLAALADARQARGYSDDYHRYDAWQPTPAGDEGRSAGSEEGVWALQCGDLPEALEQRISAGLNGPGGYLTHKNEGLLLVLPSEGLVVFAYNG
jgi:hypothetical protein